MSISFVLITFLLQMSVGMIATVAILPSHLVDYRFFKSISFWATLFTGLALFFQHSASFVLPEVFSGGRGSVGLQKTSQVSFYIFGGMTFLLWMRLRFWEGILSQKTL